MQTHPVADLFPMLPADELAELAADIKTRGLVQPIVLDAEGRVLDGRNRLAACELAGVEPVVATYEGDDPDGYALAVNIARRHLSTGARAVIAAQAARLNGRAYKSVTDDDKLSAPRISEAGLVLEWAPDLADAVVAGAKPLSVAVTEARERKTEAEALAAKMDRLADESPDLRVHVDEERMDVDDAIAALDARQAKTRDEQQQREADRREQVRRDVERLEALVVGWVALTSLPDHPHRDDILSGLNNRDRQTVLDIEQIYQEVTS